MPLARIISHYPSGCRDLAMDLLARGYAVEIVEPDNIPDNFADLELRVDTPTVNAMAAKPAVQDNRRSASLDFVQHMKEPMPNFLRRPPTRDDLIAAGISVGPEPKVAEIKPQAKVAAEVMPQQKAVGETKTLPSVSNYKPVALISSPRPELKVVEQIKSPTPEPGRAVESGTPNVQPVPKQEIPVITPPEQVIAPATSLKPVSAAVTETTKRPRTRVTITIHHSQLTKSARKIISNTFLSSNARFLRASVGFAATVALGGILLMGVRGSDPVVERAAANTKNNDVKGIRFPPAELNSSLPVAPKNSTSAPQSTRQGAVQSSVAPSSGSPTGKSKGEGSLAKDLKPEAPTVQREKPSPQTTLAGRKHARHHHGDGLIAKDTVTYLKK